MSGADVRSWGVNTIYDDDLRRHDSFGDAETLWPCFVGLSMGWSWSLFFCQSMVENLAVPRSLLGCLVQERRPAPPLLPERPATAVYADNVNNIGFNRADAIAADDRFAAAAAKSGIGIHGDPPGKLLLDTLGVVFDFARRRLHHRPRRAWRLYLATGALIGHHTLHGSDLAVWAGHVVNYFSFEPAGLSCLQHTYTFIGERRHHRAPLTQAVREEMCLVKGLIFITEVTLDATPHQEVMVTDSATHGMAVLFTQASSSEVLREWRWKEKWRFRDVELPSPHVAISPSAVEWLGGLSPLGGATCEEPALHYASTEFLGSSLAGVGAGTFYGKQVAAAASQHDRSDAAPGRQRHKMLIPGPPTFDTAVVELTGSIPGIHSTWKRPFRWKRIVAKRWRHPEEHINIKEARASIIGVKRQCKHRFAIGSKALGLTDNMVSLFL